MNMYYIHDGSNERGPFVMEDLKKQKITRTTPVRLANSDKWFAAHKLKELKLYFTPRKIEKPKDVMPAMVETIQHYHYRRPVALYGVMACIAMVSGFSIYSLGNNTPKEVAPVQVKQMTAPVVKPEETAITAEVKEPVETKKLEPVDKEKAARQRWSKLITATNSNYGIGVLGGIKDLNIIVKNRSNYLIDEAVVKLTYIKANGEVWKTKLETVSSIPARGALEKPVKDVGRCKKVKVSLFKVVSKKMNFSYTEGQKIINPEDPYFKL